MSMRDYFRAIAVAFIVFAGTLLLSIPMVAVYAPDQPRAPLGVLQSGRHVDRSMVLAHRRSAPLLLAHAPTHEASPADECPRLRVRRDRELRCDRSLEHPDLRPHHFHRGDQDVCGLAGGEVGRRLRGRDPRKPLGPSLAAPVYRSARCTKESAVLDQRDAAGAVVSVRTSVRPPRWRSRCRARVLDL